MKLPLDLRTLGMDPSPALDALLREKVAHLERLCADLIACRVTVEALHRHRTHGHPYAVRIDLTRPGEELAIDRVEDEDVHVAVRCAFDAMTRRLEDSVRRARDRSTAPAGGAL